MAYASLSPRELATLYVLKQDRIDQHNQWIDGLQHEQWKIFNAALEQVSASEFSKLVIEAKKMVE